MSETEKLKLEIEIWKTVVETQRHFNDLGMKVKNYGILILSAFIGAIGVSFKTGFTFFFLGNEVPVASLLAFAASAIWFLFYLVDVHWYHPLLKGSVKKGDEIEKGLKRDFPNINLAETISDASPKRMLFWAEVHSTSKARIFYFGVLGILLISSIVFFFCDKCPTSGPP